MKQVKTLIKRSHNSGGTKLYEIKNDYVTKATWQRDFLMYSCVIFRFKSFFNKKFFFSYLLWENISKFNYSFLPFQKVFGIKVGYFISIASKKKKQSKLKILSKRNFCFSVYCLYIGKYTNHELLHSQLEPCLFTFRETITAYGSPKQEC